MLNFDDAESFFTRFSHIIKKKKKQSENIEKCFERNKLRSRDRNFFYGIQRAKIGALLRPRERERDHENFAFFAANFSVYDSKNNRNFEKQTLPINYRL